MTERPDFDVVLNRLMRQAGAFGAPVRRHAKTQRILQAAMEVLEAENPQTLRQVFYQLVSRQVVENSRGSYLALSDVLVTARKSGEVPWEWMEDRTRRPRRVPMWGKLSEYIDPESFKREVWDDQPALVEVWLEKDALSGIFEAELVPYGVTLCVGRGYDGWDSLHNASERYIDWLDEGRSVVVLYFGDHDPSGEDMVRSLRDRLAELGSEPEVHKVAITLEDVEKYQLPPNPTKSTDKRTPAYRSKHGDRQWELDALPATALRDRIKASVESHMDLEKLRQVWELEGTERKSLERIKSRLAKKERKARR